MTTAERKPQSGLRFYPKSHRYKLDGEWVPGVTTINGVIDKPGLKKWAATAVAEWVVDNWELIQETYDASGRNPTVALLKEIPWQKRDTAADRGTTFHDFAERIMNGEEPEVPESQQPLVESALAFMSDYDIQPLLVEGVVGSRKHRYAGKGDLWAESKVGPAYFDWKSGKRIYPNTALQAAGYCFAEFHGENGDEHPLPEVGAAYGVHIREDGYSVVPLKFGPDVFDEFLVVRQTYDINKRVEGNWREAGSGYAGIPLETEDWWAWQ
jgi:hypothetical protein